MGRVFRQVALVLGVCFLCSCVGKFSLIDSYYTTPKEGEETVVEQPVVVEEEISGSPEMVESELAVEVIEEEPIK